MSPSSHGATDMNLWLEFDNCLSVARSTRALVRAISYMIRAIVAFFATAPG